MPNLHVLTIMMHTTLLLLMLCKWCVCAFPGVSTLLTSLYGYLLPFVAVGVVPLYSLLVTCCLLLQWEPPFNPIYGYLLPFVAMGAFPKLPCGFP